jgi:hypothetical protein
LDETGVRQRYSAPTVTHHGTVADLTLSHHLVIGAKAVNFAAAFAASTGAGVVAPAGPETITVPGPTGGAGTSPGAANTITNITNTPGGGTGTVGTHVGNAPGAGTGGISGSGPGTSGGGSGGGGKTLPFTGLAVIGVAGVGAALASAGGVLRRVTRRRGATS